MICLQVGEKVVPHIDRIRLLRRFPDLEMLRVDGRLYAIGDHVEAIGGVHALSRLRRSRLQVLDGHTYLEGSKIYPVK